MERSSDDDIRPIVGGLTALHMAEMAKAGIWTKVGEKLMLYALANGLAISGIAPGLALGAKETLWQSKAREFTREALREFLEEYARENSVVN